ncbi:hypothetical protein M5G07_13290 [Serratia symbiotica]|nr:hypothetical protein [Serratia symbiotica]
MPDLFLNLYESYNALSAQKKVAVIMVINGPIAALLVINRHVLEKQKAGTLEWPLNSDDCKTGKQGQVKELGVPATQKVLSEYGLMLMLASEGS